MERVRDKHFFDTSVFKSEHVYSYSKEQINEPFKNFHCRGSSEKENIDTNHKLMIFVQHGNNLYHWTYFTEACRKEEMKVTCYSISSTAKK